MNFIDRLDSYDEDHCWQYDIRLKNYIADCKESGLSIDEVSNLSVSDFVFKNITDKPEQKIMIEFINRHEWLGNISQYTTHWFGAYYKDILSGVILLNMPNSFSKSLGENTPQLERLISRGACISWSPKNLASSFLMWIMRWMVKNTDYRLFTAYSDPTAKELGTIYQACNFYYMGNTFGGSAKYINPYTGKMVSDRFFRQKTAYKKFAKELNIEWKDDWNHPTGMRWENIPDEIELALREYSKFKQNQSTKIEVPHKHKYAYVLGKTKAETKQLRKIFLENNKVFVFPKIRGE